MAPRAIVAVLPCAEPSSAVVFREGTARLRLFNQSAAFGPFARVCLAAEDVPADALCVVHRRHAKLASEVLGGRASIVLSEESDVAAWLAETLERARDAETICGVVSVSRGDEASSFAVLAALQTLLRRTFDSPAAKRPHTAQSVSSNAGDGDAVESLCAEAAALADDARTAHENVGAALRRMRKAVARRLDGLVAGLRLAVAEQSAADAGESCPDCALLEDELAALRRDAEETERMVLRHMDEWADVLAALRDARCARDAAQAETAEVEARLNLTIADCRERIEHLEVDASRLRDECERMAGLLAASKRESASLAEESAALSAALVETRAALGERDEALKSAHTDVAEAMAAVRRGDDATFLLRKEVDSLRADLEALRAEHAECAVEAAQARAEAARLRAEHASRCAALADAAAARDEAASDAEHRLARAGDALAACRARVSALCAELAGATGRADVYSSCLSHVLEAYAGAVLPLAQRCGVSTAELSDVIALFSNPQAVESGLSDSGNARATHSLPRRFAQAAERVGAEIAARLSKR